MGLAHTVTGLQVRMKIQFREGTGSFNAAQAIVQFGKGPNRVGSSKAEVERIEDGRKATIKINTKDDKAERVMLKHGDVVRPGESLF